MTWRKWVPFGVNVKWKWSGLRRELGNRFWTKPGDCIQVDPKVHVAGSLLAVVDQIRDDGIGCHWFRPLPDAPRTSVLQAIDRPRRRSGARNEREHPVSPLQRLRSHWTRRLGCGAVSAGRSSHRCVVEQSRGGDRSATQRTAASSAYKRCVVSPIISATRRHRRNSRMQVRGRSTVCLNCLVDRCRIRVVRLRVSR